LKDLIVLAAVLFAASCSGKAPEAYHTEAVSRGTVNEIVSATGDVEAIITVNVGSQVSGIISKLYVDWNSVVKKGQLLATIDPRLFQAQLEMAAAGHSSAVANVEKSQAALDDALRQEKRLRELRADKLVAQGDLETAVANREGAAAQLSASKAAVLQAKANRDLANTNLVYTKISSPIDGVVISRAIDVGQTVAAAFQAPTLFTIANDLTKMQILANIDEADVGKVAEGLQTRFTVDAYPGETFRGRIREVRQSPTTIQNVVTYAAVIDAPNPEHKLRPGMTAAVQITAARHDDVLRVPNAALRWKPDDFLAPPAEERTAGRERVGAEKQEQPAAAGRAGRVFKLQSGKPALVNVRIGLSDGQRSEVLAGLAEGDAVITSDASGGGGGGAGRPSGGPGGGRRGPF